MLFVILYFHCQGMHEFIYYICNILRSWSRSTPVFNTVYSVPLYQNVFCHYFTWSSLIHHTKVLINCEHFSLIFINTCQAFFQSILYNWQKVEKNKTLIYENFKLIYETQSLVFFPILFTYSSNSLVRYLQTHIKQSCMYLSVQLFFKTLHETLKFQEKSKKKIFFHQTRPKCQKIFPSVSLMGPPKRATKLSTR